MMEMQVTGMTVMNVTDLDLWQILRPTWGERWEFAVIYGWMMMWTRHQEFGVTCCPQSRTHAMQCEQTDHANWHAQRSTWVNCKYEIPEAHWNKPASVLRDWRLRAANVSKTDFHGTPVTPNVAKRWVILKKTQVNLQAMLMDEPTELQSGKNHLASGTVVPDLDKTHFGVCLC
jgi:hypothetical protein